jgi:hypothetical protein
MKVVDVEELRFPWLKWTESEQSGMRESLDRVIIDVIRFIFYC